MADNLRSTIENNESAFYRKHCISKPVTGAKVVVEVGSVIDGVE
jgi:hypothetical protein